MLFLLVLSTAKIGPRSQNRSSVCGTPPTGPRSVRPCRRFEVDDFCSEEREHVARQWSRPVGRHVQDAQTLERKRRRGSRRPRVIT